MTETESGTIRWFRSVLHYSIFFACVLAAATGVYYGDLEMLLLLLGAVLILVVERELN